MKSKQSLSIFIVFLLVNMIFSLSSKAKFDKPLRGYFYIQRFYPGNDAIDNIKESEFHTRLMFFEVNKDVIYFSKSLQRIQDIEDSISVKDLYDPKMDDMRSGKCCTRMKYTEFPGGKGLSAILSARAQNTKKGKPIIKKTAICENKCNKNPLVNLSKPKKQMQKSRISPKLNANFCLDLLVPEEARWRICHYNQDKISELHMKLMYYVLSSNFQGKLDVITSFLANSRIAREPPLPAWNWDSQNNWKGKCKSNIMQSPINILPNMVKKAAANFSISYHLLPVHTMIKRNQKEIIATFLNFGGIIQVSIDGTYLLFTPTYMSFRFPGEHLFSGERFMGEIILHLAELSTQRKSSTTNGLNITIPIKPTSDGLDIESFERLNIDFWRYEVEKHGTYTPKKFLKKKLLAFDLGDLFKKVIASKPDLLYYMGSHTTPPCEEQTYHIVVNKPLVMAGCQFKLLRENSLISNRAKDIHARLEQPVSDRTLYRYSSMRMQYLKDISGIVPQSFNKYLLKHGYGYKSRGRGGRRGKLVCIPGKGCFYRKRSADDWLDELNCDIPKENEDEVPTV